ncbi:MAG: tetratricopeptide repeat protein, partial [Candidatus Desulfofervidaceae bacterium]|nr:tetratricopeptide repeat protein [Candidatus Desulfofervidaceae bacterium]
FKRGCWLDDNPETMSQAEEAYLEALKLNKDFVPAMINLANIYYIQGRMFQAAMWYELALKKSPENAEVHFNYANLLEDQGHLEEALLHYQMATVLKPNFAEAHYNLALIYEKQGKPLLAYKHWKSYLKFASDEKQKEKVLFYLKQKYKLPLVDKS